MTPSLTFRHPRPEEMALRQAWMADPELMSYNAGWDVSHPGYHPETGCIDFPEDEWAAAYERLVGDPPAGTRYWFVEREGEVVGHAHHRRAHTADAHVAEIGFMVVPASRGQGLGRLILAELVGRAFAAGFTAIRNEFEDTREPALSLHREIGFEIVARSQARAGDRTVVTVELRRGADRG